MYYPSATYRVQLNSTYTFSQLQNIVDYLHKLGVSTIYASPITKAMKGSTHGYDVCNPDVLNAEIGTEEQLQQLHKSLSEKGMGWLQDIVPNHMAFLCSNERIFDIMERGPNSPYYNYFDIDWDHYDPVYKGKLMVPFIGKDLDEAIDNGDINISLDEEGFQLAYSEDKYPVAVDSLSFLFSLVNDTVSKAATLTLLSKINADKEEWNKTKKIWLQDLFKNENGIRDAIARVNGDKALLRNFLDHQYYIFTCYKVTDQEINFRRFFTVNQLICLRMEEENVFTDYHHLILRLYKEGLLQGLRIDHIDGLYNPQQYIERLRKTFGDDCYIIAEKILEYNENIAQDWNLQGTSGYEFLSFVNQLVTDKKGSERLLSFYKELVPETPVYEDMVWNKKHTFLLTKMGGELANLRHMIQDLDIFPKRSYSTDKMEDALGNLMASFPVYRIYPDAYPLHKEAIFIVTEAFERAEKHAGDAGAELALLKTVFDADGTKPGDDSKLLFLKRLMQFTGPLAAKGVEDTTFYVYNPLISHNEVGDAPSQLGISTDEFHEKMISRQRNNPYSLNATSTHDTKRGEDGRMRINALAAMPGEWIQQVNNWRQMNTSFIKRVNNKPAPSANDEYFIYQSLVGAFPDDCKVTDEFRERSYAFLEKALREAKTETTYDDPNVEYEQACKDFVTALLDASHPFFNSFIAFFERILPIADQYSVAQTVIKITAPGIPDIYQGCELWNTSYVDPDNRRPVDYNLRKNLLDTIIEKEHEGLKNVLSFVRQNRYEGREKLFVTYKSLQLRTSHNDLFLQGDYIPLPVNHGSVIAFARIKDERYVVVIIPFTNDITDADSNLAISMPGNQSLIWKNIFTGAEVPASSLHINDELKKFPIAVLTSGIWM